VGRMAGGVEVEGVGGKRVVGGGARWCRAGNGEVRQRGELGVGGAEIMGRQGGKKMGIKGALWDGVESGESGMILLPSKKRGLPIDGEGKKHKAWEKKYRRGNYAQAAENKAERGEENEKGGQHKQLRIGKGQKPRTIRHERIGVSRGSKNCSISYIGT